MKKKRILLVVGTRPNFIKVTQFKKHAANFPDLELKIVHTGQHYDSKMTDVFFEQFNLVPDYFLNINTDSALSQIASIMLKLEELIKTEFNADLLIAAGDVNSTLAAAITANKLEIKLAHLEGGLRSFDKSMPEEHNRIITDQLADYFFVTEQSGVTNLLKEGKKKEQIYFVGNTMIDTLVSFENKIQSAKVMSELNVTPKEFVLMTMHRPSTVDTRDGLSKLVEVIELITNNSKLVFPIHPRTLKNLREQELMHRIEQNINIILTEPLDYFAFQNLIYNSKYIITDSGGIQEESTFLGIPCLTLRANTERPVTCETGTNTLISFDLSVIKKQIDEIENGNYKKGNVPQYWDGKATERIMDIINSLNS
jgi:UDP-N-acetylglucosamine 2-epimerase (non-hydrolysing)